MGCFCSRYSYNDREEQQDATTPLLQRSHSSTSVGKRKKMSRETSLYYTIQQEEEMWKSVVDGTSKRMIDINLYPSMNPLSPVEIEERQKKYTEILNKVKLPRPLNITKSPLSNQQQELSSVVKILEEAKRFDRQDILYEMKNVDYARNQINKSFAGHGDVVVPIKKKIAQQTSAAGASSSGSRR